jgi:hypothetical protein
MAAVLACGPSAVLSHHSAAALWGIRDNRSGPIHTTSPSKSRSREAIHRHFAVLSPDEVTSHHGIPVTTAARTIFDLAPDSPNSVEPALRQSEYLRLYGPLSLADLTARYPRHRGNRAVKAALARGAEASGHTASPLEDRFLPFLDRHHLPRPQLNAWIVLDTARYKVDCLWPDIRQIVELDSWSAHGTRSAFRNDKARDRKLQAAGYTVTRVSWSQLDDEAEAIAADLRALVDPPRSHT